MRESNFGRSRLFFFYVGAVGGPHSNLSAVNCDANVYRQER